MTSASVLNFLINALWQVTLVAAAAWLAERLLRSAPARYRHRVWVSALVVVVILGIANVSPRPAVKIPISPVRTGPTYALTASQDAASAGVVQAPNPMAPPISPAPDTGFAVPARVAALIAGLYFAFVSLRLAALLRAWVSTRAVVRRANSAPLPDRMKRVVANCCLATGARRVRFATSATVASPFTVGALTATVVLPEALLEETDEAVLTCAIGHELVHVVRRDYLWNFVYRLLMIPFSFQPAVWLLQGRIRQTRELSCDEQVAESLLPAAVYARSLLELAGAAKFGHPAATVAVGISDADILEERIMYMLQRPKLSPAKRALLSIGAALVFAAPCIAAAPHAAHLNIGQEPAARQLPKPAIAAAPVSSPTPAPAEQAASPQAPSVMPRPAATVGFAYTPRSGGASQEAHMTGFVYAPASSAELQERREQERKLSPEELQAVLSRQHEEMAARNKQLAELAKQAKITMQQAIEIASREHSGAVAETNLMGAEDFVARGPDGKRALVDPGAGVPTYRIVIVSGDDENLTRTIVFVNAVDGTIVRAAVE